MPTPRQRLVSNRSGALVLSGLLAGVCACATSTARNHEDPDGPLWWGHYGRSGGSAAELRVVSFNVNFAKHVDRVIALLQEPPLRAADVLLLQELDEEAAERLARTLGFDYVYASSAVHPKTGRNFGNAVFTPWRIESARKLLLPYRGRLRGLRRSAVTATVALGGQLVQVYGVHLETRLDLGQEERLEQARRIFEDARSSPHPVIVAGDWNGGGVDELARSEGFCWPTRSVGRTIAFFSWDHIFARGFAAPGGSGAAPRQGASDHRPVWALLTTRNP